LRFMGTGLSRRSAAEVVFVSPSSPLDVGRSMLVVGCFVECEGLR
jgi:hypothetical protein